MMKNWCCFIPGVSLGIKTVEIFELILVCSRVQTFPILNLKWILLNQMNVLGLSDVCKNGAFESEDPECYRSDDIYESGKISSSVAWENSRNFATPSLVSPWNGHDVWGTSAKIPYWWMPQLDLYCASDWINKIFNQSELLPRSE